MAREKVDTRPFNALCDQLSKLVPSVKVEQIVDGEVGKTLEGAVRNTKVASASRIKKRYDEFVPLGMDAYSPKQIRRFGNLKGNNLVYYMENRYPNALWSRLRARRVQLIARLRQARGLARRSWLDIADQMGLQIDVPGYVRTAVATTGKTYRNTSAKRSRNKGGYSVRIINAQPTAINTNAARAIQRAMDGRSKYFLRQCEHGVFGDVAKVAKAYPGFKMKLAA